MKEIIKTSTTVIGLGDDSHFAEVEECRTDEKIEIRLLTFKDCPRNSHTLIMKCVGTPDQYHEFMMKVYASLKSLSIYETEGYKGDKIE